MLLSTAYFPPVEYFQKIVSSEKIFIEKHEHFIKQTYRNRCHILGANGVLALSVPLVNPHQKTPISEKRITYTEKWQHQHWRSIESSYRNSPYFIYYEDELKVFFEKKYEFLFEYNTEILKTLLKLLKVKSEICFTENYKETNIHPELVSRPHEMLKQVQHDEQDFRNSISPKVSNEEKSFKPYIQVFSDKYGFKPNLSILDLLFNKGPGAKGFL
jgi:hypothetical protein